MIFTSWQRRHVSSSEHQWIRAIRWMRLLSRSQGLAAGCCCWMIYHFESPSLSPIESSHCWYIVFINNFSNFLDKILFLFAHTQSLSHSWNTAKKAHSMRNVNRNSRNSEQRSTKIVTIWIFFFVVYSNWKTFPLKVYKECSRALFVEQILKAFNLMTRSARQYWNSEWSN